MANDEYDVSQALLRLDVVDVGDLRTVCVVPRPQQGPIANDLVRIVPLQRYPVLRRHAGGITRSSLFANM